MLGMVLAADVTAEPLPAFAELLDQAERSAPRLIEAAALVQVAQGLAEQAAAFPNPSLAVGSENIAGTGAFSGFSKGETTVSLSEVVEIGGKRRSRIAAGRADLEVARVSHRLLRAEFAHDLAVAYAAAEVAQGRVELTAEELTRAEEDQRIVRSPVRAGRESDSRAIQPDEAVARTRTDLETARAGVADALICVSNLAGLSQSYTAIGPSLLKSASTLKISSTPPPQLTPAVLAAHAERESAARRVDVERTRSISDVTVSLGSRRLNAEGANALVAGVSVSLPIFDRNRGAITARIAELAVADARLKAVLLEVNTNWRASVTQAQAAENGLKAAEETEAGAREAYRLARDGYESGRTPLTRLLDTRRDLTDAQMRSLDARFARVQAEASLARLQGRVPFGE